MHYKASNRHYLNEAVNADYNVIKTSMDATYGETMKTYLMSSVTLQGQDDSGKPTQIKFNPTTPLGTIKRMSKSTGTNYDVDVLDPVYSCVENAFLERTDSVFEYQKAYASSIGATEQTAAATARSTWESELKKIGTAGCKAVDALSKGLPNPLIPKVAASNTTQQKTPATKGTGSVASYEIIGNPPSIFTAENLAKVGLTISDAPNIDGGTITQDGNQEIYGGYFYWGGSRFECTDGSTNTPKYKFSSAPYQEPVKSAYTTYKAGMEALGKQQCLANSKWLDTAQAKYLDKEGKYTGTGPYKRYRGTSGRY